MRNDDGRGRLNCMEKSIRRAHSDPKCTPEQHIWQTLRNSKKSKWLFALLSVPIALAPGALKYLLQHTGWVQRGLIVGGTLSVTMLGLLLRATRKIRKNQRAIQQLQRDQENNVRGRKNLRASLELAMWDDAATKAEYCHELLRDIRNHLFTYGLEATPQSMQNTQHIHDTASNLLALTLKSLYHDRHRPDFDVAIFGLTSLQDAEKVGHGSSSGQNCTDTDCTDVDDTALQITKEAWYRTVLHNYRGNGIWVSDYEETHQSRCTFCNSADVSRQAIIVAPIRTPLYPNRDNASCEILGILSVCTHIQKTNGEGIFVDQNGKFRDAVRFFVKAYSNAVSIILKQGRGSEASNLIRVGESRHCINTDNFLFVRNLHKVFMRQHHGVETIIDTY